MFVHSPAESSVEQDNKQVQVDLQDLGYETCGRSENEAEREEASSPGKDRNISVMETLVYLSECCIVLSSSSMKDDLQRETQKLGRSSFLAFSNVLQYPRVEIWLHTL